MNWKRRLVTMIVVLSLLPGVSFGAEDPATENKAKEPLAPNQSDLPVAPPKDAIVLYDGKGVNLFLSKEGGKIDWPVEDGTLVSTRGMRRANHVVSKLHFRDAEIHVEFMLPPKGSGNSGVYIHGNYSSSKFG